MKLTSTSSVVTALLLSETFAAPAVQHTRCVSSYALSANAECQNEQPIMATTNPFEGFPKLSGLDGRLVYRLYLANGMVIDAARLTVAQIQTWVDVRAPFLTEADAKAERTIYASSNSEAVSDAQLLTPTEDLKPKSQLERLLQTEISFDPRNLLLGKR
ncbi:hypothetical protein LTR49_014835 [Elasticomyces elasticus]|nr:hypothetical protein LTR49_014835 [Elasticomyces elasticus]KAK5746719.1 hypothetical protein LTS12_022657 [Elasticomyces elasticus]